MKMTIIKHDEIASPNFRKNSDWCNDHGISNICCICGKAIKDEDGKMLHWFDGGDLLTDFDTFPDELRKRAACSGTGPWRTGYGSWTPPR